MNSHSSHIIANVIIFCTQNAINLFIVLLYCLNLFQFLDVNVFVLLKFTLNKEIDIIN